jgi:hypothetical protein
VHVELLRALVQLPLRVAADVDAPGRPLRVVARAPTALARLLVGRAPALLRLPVVTDVLEAVLQGGVRRPMRRDSLSYSSCALRSVFRYVRCAVTGERFNVPGRSSFFSGMSTLLRFL